MVQNTAKDDYASGGGCAEESGGRDTEGRDNMKALLKRGFEIIIEYEHILDSCEVLGALYIASFRAAERSAKAGQYDPVLWDFCRDAFELC